MVYLFNRTNERTVAPPPTEQQSHSIRSLSSSSRKVHHVDGNAGNRFPSLLPLCRCQAFRNFGSVRRPRQVYNYLGSFPALLLLFFFVVVLLFVSSLKRVASFCRRSIQSNQRRTSLKDHSRNNQDISFRKSSSDSNQDGQRKRHNNRRYENPLQEARKWPVCLVAHSRSCR